MPGTHVPEGDGELRDLARRAEAREQDPAGGMSQKGKFTLTVLIVYVVLLLLLLSYIVSHSSS
jgi:hypothetical protein